MAKTLIWGIPMQYVIYAGSGLVGMVIGGIAGAIVSLALAPLGMIVGYIVGTYVGWKVYEKFR